MKYKTKRLQSVWHFEWLQFYRQPALIGMLILFTLFGSYGIYNGRVLVKKQLLAVDSLNQIGQTHLKELIARYHADTTTAQGKMLAQQAGIPQVVEFRNPPYAVNPPKALAMLAVGQRDLLPFFDLVNTKRNNLTPPDLEIANPEKLAAGNFDLSFVLVYLYPLLVILWCHNVLSQEKELQTDRLLKVQGINIGAIVTGKLLFRFLVLCSLAALISIAGFILSPRQLPVPVTEASVWVAAIVLYFLFWFALSLLIIRQNLSSRQNALLLLGIWFLLVILLPALFAESAELAHPLPSKANLNSQARIIAIDTWEIPRPQLIDSFYQHNPCYVKLRQVNDTAQYGNKRFSAYQDLLQRRLTRTARVYYGQVRQHNTFLNRLNWINPVTAMQNLLNADAETGLADYLQFEQQVNVFQQTYTTYLNKYLLTEKQIKLKDLHSLPRFSLQKNDQKFIDILLISLPLISLLSILLIAIINYPVKK